MKFRIARHTNNLQPLIDFYTQILDLEILGDFKNHNDYDGVFIGKKGADWHMEFTSSSEPAVHHFDEDDLMVFYPAHQRQFDSMVQRCSDHQLQPLQPKNPYWQENGLLFTDPDGYGVIIAKII